MPKLSQKKDIVAAQTVLARGISLDRMIDFVPSEGGLVRRELPINAAALTGYLPMVALLVERGASLSNNPTLLRDAVRSGSPELVKWLIEQGLDVNENRPIDAAIRNDNLGMFRLLVDAGAHIAGSTTNLIHMALAHASEENMLPFINLFLENGYRINEYNRSNLGIRDFIGSNIAYTSAIARVIGHDMQLAQWLLEHGALITPHVMLRLEREGMSIYNNPLLDAIAFHNTQEAMSILEEYRGINELSPQVKALHKALILAAAQGLKKIVLKILKDYAQVLDIESLGTALESAAINGHTKVIKSIFDFYKGSMEHNPAVWRPYLNRALIVGAVQRRASTVEFLLNQDFLYKLGLSINQAGMQVEAILNNPHLDKIVRGELEKLLAMINKYRVRSSVDFLSRVRIPVQLRHNEAPVIERLPRELILQILGHAYTIPGFGSSE